MINMGKKLLVCKCSVTLSVLCKFGSISGSGFFVKRSSFDVSLSSEMRMWAKFLELNNLTKIGCTLSVV